MMKYVSFCLVTSLLPAHRDIMVPGLFPHNFIVTYFFFSYCCSSSNSDFFFLRFFHFSFHILYPSSNTKLLFCILKLLHFSLFFACCHKLWPHRNAYPLRQTDKISICHSTISWTFETVFRAERGSETGIESSGISNSNITSRGSRGTVGNRTHEEQEVGMEHKEPNTVRVDEEGRGGRGEGR